MSKNFLIAVLCLQGMLTSLFSEEAQEQLKQELQTITQALNEGNIDKISSLWTDDAEMSRPLLGDVLVGKEQILKFLKERSQELKERKLRFSFKSEKVEFPKIDEALVQGIVEIGNEQGLYFRNAREIELIKQNGKWLISSVSDIEVAPAPPIYSNLKEIEWLIGNWQDKDEEVAITFANRWGKFKNFMISQFSMSVFDAEVLEGVQIIGWNPIEQKIESWVFDSDGGHGSGFWSKKGDSWEVALNYVLSDGKKASGTNIYTKVDDTHYRFASKERKIDGEAVPNVEPVTVSKEG